MEFIESVTNGDPIAEVFVLEAVRKYSEQIAALDPKILEGHSIVHGPTWQAIAKRMVDRMEKRYDD